MPDGSSPLKNGGDTSILCFASAESKGPANYTEILMTVLSGASVAGLAQYLNIDVVLVRILFVVFTLIGGAGIWVYIILMDRSFPKL